MTEGGDVSDVQREVPVLLRLLIGHRDERIPAADCPQCGRKGTAAPVAGLPLQQSFGGGADYTFGMCCECGEICGLTVSVLSLDGDLSTQAYGFPQPLMSGVSPKQTPTLSADVVVVPPHMPANVENLFRQARHNLLLGNWDSAGMTYRKTLEVCLHEKYGIKLRTLASTIRRVSESQPSVFKLFAWLTRSGGNEAAHEAQFSEPAALLLDSHVEQLVVYLFTVPEVKARATR